MSLWNALRRWTNGRPKSAGRKRCPARRRTRPPVLEVLESRLCPSGGYLLVSSSNTDSVLRYDESSGAFVDAFVPAKSGGLRFPTGVLFGPADHNLYVASGLFVNAGNGHKDVLRYDGSTGAFIDDFADDNQVTDAKGIIFGPDGNLYVANVSTDDNTGTILRYDGTTGAFLGDFVGPNAVGQYDPNGLVFGPDGKNDGKLDLYVADAATNSILRWDANGNFLGQFVASRSGGLGHPLNLTFGPDGNLYVSSHDSQAVLRYDGTTGAFLGAFVPPGSGGLDTPFGLLFGPDGKNDGKEDLYVSSDQISGFSFSSATNSQVLRYDGTTGAFLGIFVAPGSGGLSLAGFMTFTETDPTTLKYGTAGSSVRGSAAPAVQTASGTDSAAPAFSLVSTGQPAAAPVHPVPASAAPPVVGTNAAVRPPSEAPSAGSLPQRGLPVRPEVAADEVFSDLGAEQFLVPFGDELALSV